VPEIERKFLVERLPCGLAIESEHAIAQGYLALGDDEVRLRRKDERHLITVKRGRGLVRDEVEVPLAAESFDELWALTEGRRLEKTRLTMHLGGHLTEIDVYEGPLTGLTTVEIEFEDVGSAEGFSPPEWFGRELTGDEEYSNQKLALAGLPPGHARQA
jgi:CYTH domain-containing protein